METHPAQGDVDRNRAHSDPHRPIPDYLQPFIVDQETQRYTAIDQAVWRFVLLQLSDRLGRTAHPSYCRGLAQSAISPDHIPSIEEIDRGLSELGWGAVCVDGFIPPRAFQAFQALGVLPIAAEIRTPEHLPYTPAPDIIHEAAGHAPILIDPAYASYVRAVGEVGMRAFASPADDRIDRAVRLLSELKEHPSDDAALRAAELELTRAVEALGEPSEAARVARLYWWTAEYGLIGSCDDYRLYGAGLLSSLGESHFCHQPSVAKRPLSPDCTRVGYDITRPQPQLFVAQDFEHLHGVLAEVSQTLAYDIGGPHALSAAVASRELCTVYLPGGVQVIGTLGHVTTNGLPELARFDAGVALASRGRLLARVRGPYVLALGKLADGTDPRTLVTDTAVGATLDVEYASGLRLRGTRCDAPGGDPAGLLWLRGLELDWRGERISQPGPHPWVCADRVVTAGAGSACAEVSPLGLGAQPGRRERAKVPKPKVSSSASLRLNQLYSQTREAHRRGPSGQAVLAAIQTELAASHPHEWLLAWNVLDALYDLGMQDEPLSRELTRRLLELEDYYGGKHPIALGLEYLKNRKST